MLTLGFLLYRQWGFDIYKEIKKYQKIRGDFRLAPIIASKDHQFKPPKGSLVVDPNDTDKIYKLLKSRRVDILLTYSWNYFIKEPILSNFICMCLHPSLVPQNRGGTPIQNQIIAGLKDSGVSLFRMDAGMDTGPLYAQTAMSLVGDINDIFDRMINLGSIMTKNLISDYINGDFKLTPQRNPIKYPPLKRRKPEQSEIKLKDLPKMEFTDLNNLVRGLLDPYPNAYILVKGKKILIGEVERYPEKPTGLSFKLKDGWAKVIRLKKLG